MPSEPEWLASISSSTACTWFFILACLNSLLAVAGVIVIVILVSRNNKSLLSIVPLLFSIIVGFINAWFLFMMCKRSIDTEGFGWKTNLAKSAISAYTGGKYGI
jgi:xanthine/uracil permease